MQSEQLSTPSIGSRADRTPGRLGLKIAIADLEEAKLAELGKQLVGQLGEANVLIVPTDVSKIDQVVRLKDRVYEAWGEVRFTAPGPCIAPCPASSMTIPSAPAVTPFFLIHIYPGTS